ncbi:MAG: GNAT family N-acetyltransferase [Chitinophagaceae bacterium]
MEIQIKKVEDAALMQLISELSVKTFYETYEHVNTAENILQYVQLHFSVENLLREYKIPGHFFYILFVNETAAGYIKMRTDHKDPAFQDLHQIELERFYVLRKYHGQKLGFFCMKFCIQESASGNYDVLWLGVWKKNEKAIRFYKAMGFEIYSEHIFLFGEDPQEDFLMKLNIKNYKLPLLLNQN